jgi:multidrug efflux pump subunit AcrA (membrane-fusion protein)
MRYLREFRWIVPVVAIIAAFGMSCGTAKPDAAQTSNSNSVQDTQNAAIPVTLGKSESRQVAAVLLATGSLVADETSDIAPRVAGKMANISVNVGQYVSQGAVIAKIDDTNARLALATSKASVKQAEAAIRQAEARLGLDKNGAFNASTIPEVRAANANYQQALAELKQAENNEQRYRELLESGDVAMMTYEQYRTARDTARARANNAKDLLDVAVNTAKQNNQAIASARAAYESAQTQVAQAEQNIADTVIKAPFAGYISARPTAVGEYVTSASIIATILRTNPMKINIQVAEADVPSVVVGRGVSLQVDAYKDRSFAATVSAINPSVDTSSRSAVIEALVENGDNALRAGMFATVKITRSGGSTGIFVPKAAVYNDRTTQSFRLFVIQDGIAKLKVVQLGTEENGFVQILSGVDADENIALSNVDLLFEGAKVTT